MTAANTLGEGGFFIIHTIQYVKGVVVSIPNSTRHIFTHFCVFFTVNVKNGAADIWHQGITKLTLERSRTLHKL
jgi:hypothetical protein